MNREIKFRVWDANNNEMINFYELSNNPKILMDALTSSELLSIFPMQYTGLKDKDGKEIYEGDVLIYNQIKVVCKYIEASFRIDYVNVGFNGGLGIGSAQLLEVIGNIYENPELLK